MTSKLLSHKWVLLAAYTRDSPDQYRADVAEFARDFARLSLDSPASKRIVLDVPNRSISNRPFSERHFERSVLALESGDIGQLWVHSGEKYSGEAAAGPSLAIAIDLVERYRPAQYANYVATEWPLDSSAKLSFGAILERSFKLWRAMRAPYACGIVSASQSELNSICAGSTVDLLALHGFPLYGQWERAGWSSNQAHLDRYVRGVFWGNYLTAGHLNQLGPQLADLGGLAVVRQVDPDRVFLAASDDPAAICSHKAQRAMDALSRALSDLVMPRDPVGALPGR